MAFNINELNLSNIAVSTGGSRMKPGKYICVTKNAKLENTKANDGSKLLYIEVENRNGDTLPIRINVHLVKSKQATEIGRSQLKSMLVYGGHPTPDTPGDITSFNKLVVGVAVEKSTYKKDGVDKEGSEFHYFFDPHELEPERYAKKVFVNPVQKADPLTGEIQDDDIPF